MINRMITVMLLYKVTINNMLLKVIQHQLLLDQSDSSQLNIMKLLKVLKAEERILKNNINGWSYKNMKYTVTADLM